MQVVISREALTAALSNQGYDSSIVLLSTMNILSHFYHHTQNHRTFNIDLAHVVLGYLANPHMSTHAACDHLDKESDRFLTAWLNEFLNAVKSGEGRDVNQDAFFTRMFELLKRLPIEFTHAFVTYVIQILRVTFVPQDYLRGVKLFKQYANIDPALLAYLDPEIIKQTDHANSFRERVRRAENNE